MINNLAIEITKRLESIPAIVEYFGEDIFWELAEEKTAAPFLVFHIEGLPPASKDHLGDYNVQLRIFDTTLSKAGAISGILLAELRTASRWRNKGVKSGYSDTSAKEGFIELTYNLKF